MIFLENFSALDVFVIALLSSFLILKLKKNPSVNNSSSLNTQEIRGKRE
jgi:hypothetical protein